MGWDYVSELLPLTDIVHPPGDTWVWSTTVEWHWQGKTEELGEKPVPAPLCSPGGSPGLRSERPTTNRLSHGTALPKMFTASIIKTFALMTEAVRISETPVSFYNTAQHNIPDESRLHYVTAGFCMAPYQIFSPMRARCHLNIIIFDLMTRLIA
jgi:hypothetical protein